MNLTAASVPTAGGRRTSAYKGTEAPVIHRWPHSPFTTAAARLTIRKSDSGRYAVLYRKLICAIEVAGALMMFVIAAQAARQVVFTRAAAAQLVQYAGATREELVDTLRGHGYRHAWT